MADPTDADERESLAADAPEEPDAPVEGAEPEEAAEEAADPSPAAGASEPSEPNEPTDPVEPRDPSGPSRSGRSRGPSQPISTLLYTNLKSWLSTRGVWLVFGAALLPLVFTGAWVGTHQGDVATTSLSVEAPGMVQGDRIVVTAGDRVNLTAVVENVGSQPVGRFNATLSVGTVSQNVLRATATEQAVIDGLRPGERRTVRLAWTAQPSPAGQVWVLADADGEDVVGEMDEFNNQELMPVQVRHPVPSAGDAPDAPTNLTGNASATDEASVRIAGLDRSPVELQAQQSTTFTATVVNDGPGNVTNATVVVEVGRVFSGRLIAFATEEQVVSLAAGEQTTVELEWTARAGSLWARATVNVSDANAAPNATTVRDPNGEDNVVTVPFAVQSDFSAQSPPEPPERQTLKDFFTTLLNLLHLRILIPFIALFYAGGVIADEKKAGTLKYLLTRPVQRWLFPATKFASGYIVAAAAVLLGITAAFALLFGTPGGDIGFLTTPLLISLVALLVYGAFFVLLGTLVDRPYLVGVAFVIGWETIAGNFVPFVQNLTFSQHLLNAIRGAQDVPDDGWRLDAGVQLLPTGETAMNALVLLLVLSVVFLVGAGVVMKRREFDV